MKIRKFLSLLLTACLALSLLPTVALAAEPTVGADFTTNPTAALTALGADKAEWDSSTKTLTLKGVNYTAADNTDIAVRLPDDATIVLAEGTTNAITGGSVTSGDCAGIYAGDALSVGTPAGLTIQGAGTLNVTGGDITAAAGTMPLVSCGIGASGSVTISGGTVTATGGAVTRGSGSASLGSYGIYTGVGSITISGGTVEATGGTAPMRSSGICAPKGDVAISGGTVTAIGGEMTDSNSYSYGIYAEAASETAGGNITVSGGTVIAKGGSGAANSNYSYGICTETTWFNSSTREHSRGDITISGGTVTATGGAVTGSEYGSSYGINAAGSVAISDAEVSATGNEASGEAGCSYGIYAFYGSVTVSGSKVEATGHTARNTSSGISTSEYGYGNVEISGETIQVTATGGAATDSDVGDSHGILAYGSVKIEGGRITATSDTAPANSAAIYACDDVTASGGNVTATGGNTSGQNGESSGIYASQGDVAISGGTTEVTATGGGTTGKDSRSCGIYAKTKSETVGGSITISGGTVTATGGEASGQSGNSYGIYAESNQYSTSYKPFRGDITISGGKLTATGGNTTGSRSTSCGIYADGLVATSGSAEVTATGGAATGTVSQSYGIDTYDSVTISGGNVTATGGTATSISSGIYPYTGDVTISGETTEVIATGGSATGTNGDSYGIQTHAGNVRIEGGQVTAAGGTASGSFSTGIYAEKDVTVTGGTVTATGGTARYDSYGIGGGDDVLISGGTVSATGGNATDQNGESYGILAYSGSIKISGGHVIAQATQGATHSALYKAPAQLPSTYDWRYAVTGSGGGNGTYPSFAYQWAATHDNVEITASDADPGIYTVTFNANGGSVTPASGTTTGGKLSSLPTPTRSDHSFNGWFTAASGGDRVTADTVFTENTTIYAQWTYTGGGNGGGGVVTPGAIYYTVTATAGKGGSISPSGQVSVRRNGAKTFTITPDEGYEVADVLVDGKSVGAVTEYTFEKVTKKHTIAVSFQKAEARPAWNPFEDVKSGDWFYDSVKYVYERGMMVGTSETTFSPDAATTRGMIVTILYRLEGEPAISGTNVFDDVAEDRYYTDAVKWAAANGIVDGYGGGRFEPDDPITREQMAAILWRYSCSPAPTETLAGFTDASKASGYALDALRWAVEQGILQGKGNGTLDPAGNATRAEAAAMLQRFCEKAGR